MLDELRTAGQGFIGKTDVRITRSKYSDTLHTCYLQTGLVWSLLIINCRLLSSLLPLHSLSVYIKLR